MVQLTVTDEAVAIAKSFRANFTHERVIMKVKFYMSFEAQSSFAFDLADFAEFFILMVILDVEIFGGNFIKLFLANVTFVVGFDGGFVFSLRFRGWGESKKKKL